MTQVTAQQLPVDDGWADVVLSNGVFNLCPDKRTVFEEVLRVLRPGDVVIGPRVDTFAGASDEAKARTFQVYGYPFLAGKPARD